MQNTMCDSIHANSTPPPPHPPCQSSVHSDKPRDIDWHQNGEEGFPRALKWNSLFNTPQHSLFTWILVPELKLDIMTSNYHLRNLNLIILQKLPPQEPESYKTTPITVIWISTRYSNYQFKNPNYELLNP